MPPEERFVPRFAAEPPQDALPYGRWEERLREEFLAAALALDGAPEDIGRAGRPIAWYPGPHLARAHLRARPPRRPAAATSCSGTSATCPAARKASRATSWPRCDFTDETAERNPDWRLDLCDEVIGTLARRERRRRGDDARLGPPAGLRRRDRHGRARRPRGRPVRAGRRALHADRARRLPPGPARHQAVRRRRAASSRASRSTTREDGERRTKAERRRDPLQAEVRSVTV